MRHRAGIVLYCKETKEVLLIRRIRDGKEYYIVAGGGVQEGETFEQTAYREIQEELGVTVDNMRPLFARNCKDGSVEVYWLSYTDRLEIDGIQGEEKEIWSENNQYYPEWIPVNKLNDILIYQEEIKSVHFE